MKVTKIVVTYFDGTCQSVLDWEHIDWYRAKDIATIEETTLMSLSEVKSRYRFINLPVEPLKIEEPDNIPCDADAKADAHDMYFTNWGHEPKGSMGT